MTIDEFMSLKSEARNRAEAALDRLGHDTGGMIRDFRTPRCLVMRIIDKFIIQVPRMNYLTNTAQFCTIYEERNGEETRLGWNHKELVVFYGLVIEEMNQALILEDLASV